MTKVIVVGANHAGTAAINTLLNGEGNVEVEVTVYEKNSNISFLGCGMALWIGEQIKDSTGLFYATKESLEAKGAKMHIEATVNKIDFQNKKVSVTLCNGEQIEDTYDKLILSTGSIPIIPNIPGKELKNVQQVKLFQNAEEVISKLKDDSIQNITVVGAGYIGVELAEAFQRKGKNVTIIELAPTCLAGYYDEEFSACMNEKLAAKGITLKYGEGLKEIKGNGKVESVVTDKGEYPSDMVLLSVGFRPNSELGKEEVDLFKNGAYLVNKRQQTSNPDVYAIGDCATVYDNSIQADNYIALATNAVRSGLVAANNILGVDLESPGVQGSNGICIFDYKMVSTGLTLQKAEKLGFEALATDFEDLQKPAFIEHDNHSVKIRIVYDKNTRRVLGAQMASYQDMSMGIHMFSLAIQEGVTIDKLKLLDIFFLPHFNQPYNYLTMAALGAK